MPLARPLSLLDCNVVSEVEPFQTAARTTLLDRPPASRDNQRMDPTIPELVLLALLSAALCGVALIYADPITSAAIASAGE